MVAPIPTDRRPRGRRILLTGGTGFVGSALCRWLVDQGDDVTAVTRTGSDMKRLAGISGNFSVVEADLADFGQITVLVATIKPDIVFHLACSTFNPPGLTAADHLDANVRGTLSLLEALKDRPETRLIYTGSAAEYAPGNHMSEDRKTAPVNVYGAMKACASLLIDAYARIYGLRTARAVFFMVYGPGEAPHRLVPSTIASALDGRTVQLNDGTVERDMLFIDDAVEGLCRMAEFDLAPGTVINLCSGAGLSIRHIAGEILRLMDSPVAIEERPQDSRPDEMRLQSGDRSRANDLLGWQPKWSLEGGLRESIAWYRTEADLAKKAR